MVQLWKYTKVTFLIIVTAGLIFSSAVFAVSLYGVFTSKEWAQLDKNIYDQVIYAESYYEEQQEVINSSEVASSPSLDKADPQFRAVIEHEIKPSAVLDAPVYLQYPELYNGCEVTSLSMLLNYYGIEKTKLDLVPEMETDPTPIQLAKDGTILYWGNPNNGFVGDVYGKKMGFGIFHGALFKLMEKYIPSSIDLTGESFEELERQISDGFPVIVWTTNDFRAPTSWIVWDTPIGPFQTTMKEHAVLMVGYDVDYVYVNDPMTGKAQVAVPKGRFIEAWEAMGMQALSYRE